MLNLPEQRLYLYEDGRLLRSFPVGIGRRPCHPDRQNLDRPKAGESDLVSDSLGAE